MTWSSNQTGVNERDLFDLATYSMEEIIKRIYVRFFIVIKDVISSQMTSSQADENGDFNRDLDLSSSESQANVKERRHRKFGKCYTIHPEESILQLGVYYILLHL